MKCINSGTDDWKVCFVRCKSRDAGGADARWIARKHRPESHACNVFIDKIARV